MNYNNTYSSFTKRALFPPVVANSIPAFNGKGKNFKIFFKKSAANLMAGAGPSNFKHIQISIRRVDSNANAINTEKYRSGYIIAPLEMESVDEPGFTPETGKVYRIDSRDDKTPYVVFLKTFGDAFKELNVLYKVQIRLGTEEYNPRWGVADVQRMNREGTVSEWSTVLTMKPIDPPFFGIQDFKDTVEDSAKKGNIIHTANFEYVGYYNSTFSSSSGDMVDTTVNIVNERLVEYSFKLLDASGKLLSDSGPIVTIEHDRPNISHSFNYLTKDMTDYYVVFSIKTQNGYVAEKKYLIKAKYKILQMSNAMVKVINERDLARMKVEVRAKQVVLEPILKKGTTNQLSKLGFVKDTSDPQYKNTTIVDQSKIKSTHAVIEGSVQTSKSFYLSCPNDIWALEAKVAGITSFKTRDEALQKPYLVIENDYSLEKDILYMTRVKIICYEKKEFIFDLDPTKPPIIENGIKKFPKNTNTPNTIYYLEAVKTSYKKINGKEIEIGTQTRRLRSATKTNITWPSNVEKFELPIYPSLNRYVHKKSRFTFKTVPATTLFDIRYTNKENPKNPIVVSTKMPARKTYSANASIPFQPKKEYYIFLSNCLGSLSLQMFDDGYTTTNSSFAKYLETKVLSKDMEIPSLDKFQIEKERM